MSLFYDINQCKFWLTTTADTIVITKQTTIKIVAMSLVGANIFLTWLNGPMRKQVLYI